MNGMVEDFVKYEQTVLIILLNIPRNIHVDNLKSALFC